MGDFIVFLTGFIAGLIIGFPFVPVFQSRQPQNLQLENSDKLLRIGGGVLYTILFLAFLLVALLKK